MSELTQIKSSSGVCKPSVVITAEADVSSMNKIQSVQWHKAMQFVLENAFGLAHGKPGHLLPLRPVAILIPAGSALASIQSSSL